MNGLNHMTVIMLGALGLLIGGVLIDLDHIGTWKCKWNGFLGEQINEKCERGILHKPVIIMSIAVFSLCLGIGILIHILMDYTRLNG